MRGVRNEYFYLDYDNLRWWSRNSFLCLSGTGNAGTSGMEDLPEGKKEDSGIWQQVRKQSPLYFTGNCFPVK